MKTPETSSLLINEIFYSVQGEGPFSGLPTIFIRTTTCQMRCRYCDTDYAFYEGTKLRTPEIFHKISEYPCKRVLITGGEPLLQKKEVLSLMNVLLQQSYDVSLETGGGIDLVGIPEDVHIVLDIKTPGSGELEKMNWNFLESPPKNMSMKFVVTSSQDYEWSKAFIRKNKGFFKNYPIYLSPVVAQYNPQDLAESILKDGLDVKLQLQLHKAIWGNQRGV